jgi:hypothetical protein
MLIDVEFRVRGAVVGVRFFEVILDSGIGVVGSFGGTVKFFFSSVGVLFIKSDIIGRVKES